MCTIEDEPKNNEYCNSTTNIVDEFDSNIVGEGLKNIGEKGDMDKEKEENVEEEEILYEDEGLEENEIDVLKAFGNFLNCQLIFNFSSLSSIVKTVNQMVILENYSLKLLKTDIKNTLGKSNTSEETKNVINDKLSQSLFSSIGKKYK